MEFRRTRLRSVLVAIVLLLVAFPLGWTATLREQAGLKLKLALIWHQHQPLYQNRLTGFYELPWVRVHAVQEYLDSPGILQEYPEIKVVYNLQPSLIEQLEDYATITPEERAQAGSYRYIGADDPHLRLALKPVEELTPEERQVMQVQFFWINPYMLDDDANDPYYSPRYAELRRIANERPLADQELVDLAALYHLWQISPQLHEKYGVIDLREKDRGFTPEEIVRIISAQHRAIQDVLPLYQEIEQAGQAEIIGSPYYHPILPLLIAPGWAGVKKEPWPESVRAQLELGIEKYQELFGHLPLGMWPPEQAVSQEIIAPVAAAGFQWMVTDETVLQKSLGRALKPGELYLPYRLQSEGHSLVVLFRDKELSDRIGFVYGGMVTKLAVLDFMTKLRKRYELLQQEGLLDKALVTVALDGENWMFMGGYPDNGRAFLRELYKELSAADWVETTTPSRFLSDHPEAIVPLEWLATGSWAGDLSTWEGEPEEDAAWHWLAEARQAVIRAEAGSQDTEEAWLAIRAAEGSDWFFWYGNDQDSGNDPMFDYLYKLHLIAAYRAVGVGETEIPQVLLVRNIAPLSAALGEVKPKIDGVAAPGEWDGAAYFSATGQLTGLWLGYGPSHLYVRLDAAESPASWIGQPLWLVLYASGDPGMAVNAYTRYGGAELGFGPAQLIEMRFDKLDPNGKGYLFRYLADGRGSWRLASQIATLFDRVAAVGSTIEFQIPYGELGLEPEKALILRASLERQDEQLALIPDRPIVTRIPKRVSGELLASFADPQGDDHGPGSYVYPTDPVFHQEPGIFDLLDYSIYDSGRNWLLVFSFTSLPNPWNGPHGFSHPLLNLYLDVAPGGAVEAAEGGDAMQIRLHPSYPWDWFLRIAGWAYGRLLATPEGQEFQVDVASDPAKDQVIVSVSKELVGTICGFHYVMVASQDGYADDYIRPVAQVAGQWVGGGSPAPTVAPKVYDYLAPEGYTQEEILSTYNVDSGEFATLIPIEIPCK
ncbi:MAG: glucodextranase DOMON-like domain-containing protein [Candidatus Bipolaricaulia bacterium]